MVLKVQEPHDGGGEDFGRIEDGSYPARLVQIIDIGEQERIDFDTGKPTGQYQRRLFLTFEFPTETIEMNGEEWPRWQSMEVTLSFHKRAKLPQIVSALDPKYQVTDLSELVGRPALVTIGSTKNGRPKITNIVQLPKGMQVEDLKSPPVVFDMDDFDVEVFNTLPNFIQNRIKEAKNFSADMLPDNNEEESKKKQDKEEPKSEAPNDFDDELPF